MEDHHLRPPFTTHSLEEDVTPSSGRLLQKASDQYEELSFRTDALYNLPAPKPWVAFMIGGICMLIGFFLWVKRLKQLRSEVGKPLKGNLFWRSAISALIDSDDTLYVITSTACVSFFFLGALQLDYRLSVSLLIGFFSILSMGDSIRVCMAFWSCDSLADAAVTSRTIKAKLRQTKQASTYLRPTSIYEDIGRGNTVVFMVFVTQFMLISIVVADIYKQSTFPCLDNTQDCPAVGTFGSWGFYVLGIFMVCVFLLGPSTNYGQSEQNPTFWLQLLLSTKRNGAKVTWYDPIRAKTRSRELATNDRRIWIRFILSFLINGVGFHVLVHMLPIQIATQSSYLGVVFRAVGMMYLVNMDDTPGYPLTIVERTQEEKEEAEEALRKKEQQSNSGFFQSQDSNDESSQDTEHDSVDDLAEQTKRIIEEAHAKIEALRGGGSDRRGKIDHQNGQLGLIAGALVGAGDNNGGNVDYAAGVDTGGEQGGGGIDAAGDMNGVGGVDGGGGGAMDDGGFDGGGGMADGGMNDGGFGGMDDGGFGGMNDGGADGGGGGANV